MNKFCCEAFPKMISTFKWHFYQDDKGNVKYTMACIAGYYLNHCPSCGKEIRGIEITEEEFYNAYHETH